MFTTSFYIWGSLTQESLKIDHLIKTFHIDDLIEENKFLVYFDITIGNLGKNVHLLGYFLRLSADKGIIFLKVKLY